MISIGRSLKRNRRRWQINNLLLFACSLTYSAWVIAMQKNNRHLHLHWEDDQRIWLQPLTLTPSSVILCMNSELRTGSKKPWLCSQMTWLQRKVMACWWWWWWWWWILIVSEYLHLARHPPPPTTRMMPACPGSWVQTTKAQPSNHPPQCSFITRHQSWQMAKPMVGLD